MGKNTVKITRKMIAFLLTAFVMLTCSFPSQTFTVEAAVKASISAKKLTITEGTSKTLSVKHATQKVTWKLSTKKYIKIKTLDKNKIKITGVKPGVTDITAKTGNQKFICKVTVRKKAEEQPKPEEKPESEESDTISYADGVTGKMANPGFWADLCAKPDQLLASMDAIEQINAQSLTQKGTNRNDLKNMAETYNGISLRESLANSVISSANRENYYANGVLVDKNTYFSAIKEKIMGNEAVTEKDTVKYAVCTKRTEVKWCPTPDYVGYSATDTDNECVDSAVCVNDPMVIKAQTADGKFYWGYTENCTGWVAAEDLAICSSKEEWLDAWEVTPGQKNFIVVTTDRIVTETSFYHAEVSSRTLTLGTRLKLADKKDIPDKLDERGDWHNYIVYMPTRDADGKYVKKIGMISEHSNVSVGYLPFTERNILKTAFECLGNRYGWGGSLDAMDCSLYVYSVYRCFGFELPRNTTWQQAMGTCVDLSGKTDEEKTELIQKAHAGSVLYFNGHEMLYLGSYNGRLYVISALGSVCDVGDSAVRTVNSVAINTLDAKRKNGSTWLSNLTGMNSFKVK